ncbi:hypothetical protein CerSpe_271380 [Prunus speciosa]
MIADELPNSKKIRFPYRGRKDDSKYCKYHRYYGHHTDDCYQLKEEIEALIRRGKLREYVTGDATPMDRHARSEVNDKPGVSRTYISTISGGLTVAGNSNRAIKRYARAFQHALIEVMMMGTIGKPPTRPT